MLTTTEKDADKVSQLGYFSSAQQKKELLPRLEIAAAHVCHMMPNRLQKRGAENGGNGHHSQLRLLAAIFQEFATSLDINATLDHATALIREYLGAEAVSLFMLEDESNLACRVCYGPISVAGMRLSIDTGIVGRAVREGVTQMVRDASADPDFNAMVDAKTGFRTRTVLCAPLRVENRRFGAIELINKADSTELFDDADRYLLTALADSAALAIHNANTAQALIEKEKMGRELSMAREIQKALLPDPRDSAFPLHGINCPAHLVSGDFYDYIEHADGRIHFAIGDVAGKGMNAALLMAKTSALFRCLAKHIEDPGSLLAMLNDEIAENATRGMFVTMIAGIYDPNRRLVTIANAGHQPVLQHRNDGDFRLYGAAAPPLGILPCMEFPCVNLALEDGCLYMFTDGVTECWTARGAELGFDGLKRCIASYADMPADRRLQDIVSSVTDWKQSNTGYLFDDITMLLVHARRE